jgi:hypothetical protein
MSILNQAELLNEYRTISSAEQRKVIKRRALDLVKASEDVDTVIFLDKTARPLAHLCRRVWEAFCPEIPKPKVKFINIGSEKVSVLRDHAVSQWHLPPFVPTSSLIDQVANERALKQIYGVENVEELSRVLKSSEGESRLVVDEASNTGNTQLLTKKILGIVDGDNTHDYFLFLDSEKDRYPFSSLRNSPITPWHSTMTLVVDEDRKSFISSPQKKEKYIEMGKQIKHEFDMLAGEIAEEIKI